jgi:YHS domain-containing protein
MKTYAGKIWLALGLLIGLAVVAPAQPPPTTSGGSGMALLNLEDTVALHGYDPVAYFTRDRAVHGNRRILERLGGATYYFASRADRYTFLENAPKYQPQFGGFCATAMAQGRREDIDPENFIIFDGKLYLFSGDEARARFLNDPRGTIAAATHNYFEMARRQRTYY